MDGSSPDQALKARSWLYLLAMGFGVALVALLEWRTDEDTVTLSVILLSSLALGAMRARSFWVAGLLIGASVFLADLFAQVIGQHPIYVHTAKPFAADPSTLALIGPALIASAMGAGIAKLVRSGRSNA